MKIEFSNTRACFVALWQELERTRQRFEREYRRFCIRRVLRDWLGPEATDDLIWEVCFQCEQEGYNLLPPPATDPMKSREFLRALVTVKLGLKVYSFDRSALDEAYHIAFPDSRPLNVRKRKSAGLRALPGLV